MLMVLLLEGINLNINHLLTSQLQIHACECLCFVSIKHLEMNWIESISAASEVSVAGKFALHRQNDGRWRFGLSSILQYACAVIGLFAAFQGLSAWWHILAARASLNLQSLYYAVYYEYSQPPQGHWELPNYIDRLFIYFFPSLPCYVQYGRTT